MFKSRQVLIAFSIVVFLTVQSITQAKTVYAIPNHNEGYLNAYTVLEEPEGHIEFKDEYDINLGNPVDVTVDVESDILFITAEGSNEVELLNARTFQKIKRVEAENATNLAGIVFSYIDQNTTHVFTIDRGSNKLFAYDWDAVDKTLTPIIPDPNDVNNPNNGVEDLYFLLEPGDPNFGSNSSVFGCGLAIDGENDLLYVSQFGAGYSSVIEVYSIADFENNFFPNVRTINLNDAFEGDDNYAVDIDIDIENQWLYAGGYTGHGNLIRYDLDRDPNASDFGDGIEEVVSGMSGWGVIGLAVDGQYIYMTTYNYLFEVWDTDMPLGLNWYRIDDEKLTQGVGGGGVCVAEVDYVPPFSVDKISDVNDGCVTPRAGEEITYTISYSFNWTEPDDPNLSAFSSIKIEDYLPGEVDFISADPDTGIYDEETHSYVWIITPENYGSPSSLDITVELNKKVTPGEVIENSVVEIVSAIAGQEYKQTAEVQTKICECADSGITIYVDTNAEGDNDGTSWTDAYEDLQSALKEAFPCDQIWVADGTYTPEDEPNSLATFRLVNAVKVYGGFDGGVSGEIEVYERDWLNNETILSGFIDPNEVNYVVTANEWIRWAILDGFTIQRGNLAGVYSEGDLLLLEHNYITDNGIGIYCYETLTPIIRNNFIYDNAIGMAFEDLQEAAIVRNNTVVDNDPMGVYADSDIEPSIRNCIFWGHADANDLIGCYATYSCIEHPTDFYEDPNETIYLGIGEGNIDDNPLFDSGTYFLSSSSPCIDTGEPEETYYHQRDIEKQFRVLYGRVDMGADEYYDCNYTSDADFNSDGIVNFPDYGEFAAHWFETVSNPNWNSLYDLAGDNEAIDANDLALFVDEWLWMDCDTMVDMPMEEQMAMDGTYESMMMSTGLSSSGLAATQAEPTLKEQVDAAQDVIDWLENLWKTDKEARMNIDKKDWEEFMDKIYEWFYAIEDSYLLSQ